MAERLGALPRPELVLFAGLMTGAMQAAAEVWVAAVRADVQDEDHHFESVKPHDYSDDSAKDPDVPLTPIADQDETSAGSVSPAHASTRDKACQGGKLTNAAVTAVRGDDGADAEVRANGDQLPLLWSGEEQAPIEQALPPQEAEKSSTQEPPPAPPRTRRSKAKGLAASTMGGLNEPVAGASATSAESSGSANDAALVKPSSANVPSNNHWPDPDCPEPSSGAQEVCLDESSQLNSRTPMGSAGAGDLPTAHVPMLASVAPLPLCPECGSSKTWRIYESRAGRYLCGACEQHFYASTPGDVSSTPSQVSSHEVVQVASEGKPEDS
jgi:hypothetical protein